MNARTWIALASLPWALLAGEASAQKGKPGPWHSDKKHGFALRLIDDYSKPVPIQPDEVYEIAKFAGPDMLLGKENVTFRTEMRIVRIELKPPETGSGVPEEAKGEREGEDAKDAGKGKQEGIEATRARTFEEWLARGSGYMSPTVVEGKKKDLALASKLPATEVEFTVKTSAKMPALGYAAVVRMTGQDIALVWAVPEKHYKDWVGSFRAAAKSFKPIEREGAPAAAAELSEVEARIAKIKEKSPGRLVEETPHYLIIYDPDKKKWLPEIKNRVEAIRGRLEQDFPPEKPITAMSVLRVCKDREEYLEYGGSPSSAGYWNSGADELVIFIMTENPSDTFRTMQHEAFHQYIYYRCGELAPHSWYNEGTGDYYAGADFKYGKFEIDIFAWRKETIRNAIREGKHVPLSKLFRYTQREYYANSDLCYAEGWSLVYFLREGKKAGAKNWNPAWESILPTYFAKLVEADAAGLDEEKARETAIQAALQGIDVDALEKAWKEFTT
ncbi:MAG: hypothetical protein ACREIU_02795 [Planctomycetota bacterium]